MVDVRIPMTATRMLRLAKIEKRDGVTIAALLAKGLKNLGSKRRGVPSRNERKGFAGKTFRGAQGLKNPGAPEAEGVRA